jgi:tetratricopeptide (TPR) repeat protein
MYDWDFSGADAAFRHSIRVQPNYATAHQWYATFLATVGRPKQALDEIRTAQNLDPTSLITNAVAGSIDLFTRHHEDAVRTLMSTVEMDPRFPTTHWFLVDEYQSTGRAKDAIGELETLKSISGNSERIDAELAYSYALVGSKDRALKYLQEIAHRPKSVPVYAYDAALVSLSVGDRDQALRWLNRAYSDRLPQLVKLSVDPRLDQLHSDSRFAALVEEVGLPQTDSVSR